MLLIFISQILVVLPRVALYWLGVKKLLLWLIWHLLLSCPIHLFPQRLVTLKPSSSTTGQLIAAHGQRKIYWSSQCKLLCDSFLSDSFPRAARLHQIFKGFPHLPNSTSTPAENLGMRYQQDKNKTGGTQRGVTFCTANIATAGGNKSVCYDQIFHVQWNFLKMICSWAHVVGRLWKGIEIMDYMYIIEKKHDKKKHLMKLKHFVDVCQKDNKVDIHRKSFLKPKLKKRRSNHWWIVLESTAPRDSSNQS